MSQENTLPTQNNPSPEREALPLSLLNDLLYCQRRAALKVIEGIRSANEHTARGEVAHENADLPGYEVSKGVTLLRALPVWSDKLGLNGKCDIVEQWPDGTLFPVEYKVGPRKQWTNDDVQLCAQAICLEEMLQKHIPRGAIFHADSKRRREVEFTTALRTQTTDTAIRLHTLAASEKIPIAVYKPACEECSLFNTCLPRATEAQSRAGRLACELFKT